MTDARQPPAPAPAGIGLFEKWLSVWVALCIVAGLALGNLIPGAFETLASWQYASVNLVVAVLIWAMVYPMMVAVDFASLSHIGDRPKGLILPAVGLLLTLQTVYAPIPGSDLLLIGGIGVMLLIGSALGLGARVIVRGHQRRRADRLV